MSLRRSLLVSLSALALLAAGCGDDEDEPTASTEATATAEASPTTEATEAPEEESPEASGEGIEITMKGFQFDPKEATVKVGQTVTWKNEDSAKHDAFSEEAGLDTDDIGQNGTTTYTPDAAGTINYICSIHPSMKATLNVEE